jgi:hypothetical protein
MMVAFLHRILHSSAPERRHIAGLNHSHTVCRSHAYAPAYRRSVRSVKSPAYALLIP